MITLFWIEGIAVAVQTAVSCIWSCGTRASAGSACSAPSPKDGLYYLCSSFGVLWELMAEESWRMSSCRKLMCISQQFGEVLTPLCLPTAAARLFISWWLLMRFKNLICLVAEFALDCDNVMVPFAVCKIAHSYKCIWIVSMPTGHSACSTLRNTICIYE